MNENLKNIILELTSSQLVVSWLELCGFVSVEDIQNINERAIVDIENYIGTLCNLMPESDREKYIDVDIFQKYPIHFKFPPCLKLRLLKASSIISKRLVKTSQLTCEVSPILKSIKKVTMRQLEKWGCVSCSPEVHDYILENLRQQLSNSSIHMLNFSLYQPKNGDDLVKYGFFSCSIEQTGQPCDYVEKFYFNADKSINLKNIASHIETHFRKLSIVSQPTLLSMTSYLNRSSSSVELADAKLCDDFAHNEIIKIAESKFINCHLVRDVDFNIYELMDENLLLTNRGCFLCYLCLKTKSTESKIKFFFTSSRAVVNSNIVAHLRLHFQSVAPTVFSVPKKRLNSFGSKQTPSKFKTRKENILNLFQIKREETADKENMI